MRISFPVYPVHEAHVCSSSSVASDELEQLISIGLLAGKNKYFADRHGSEISEYQVGQKVRLSSCDIILKVAPRKLAPILSVHFP